MNFLQLAQRLRRKCRVSGTGPVKVTDQNEEFSRLIDWINEAWMDIQGMREDWQWMRASCSFVTVAGKPIYTPTEIGLTDWGNWTRDTWRCYATVPGQAGEVLMSYLDYEWWRDGYQVGAMRTTQSQPMVVTITPAKAIGLGPTPAAGYTVTGDYYRVPTELAADLDVPALPVRFHMLIIYRAMMFYGASEAAAEVYQEGKAEYEKLLRRLNLNQMPEMIGADALA